MANDTRMRKRQFKVELFEEEFQLLTDKSKKAGLTKTAYIRDMILFGQPQEKDRSFEKIEYELNRIGNNINQMAYIANTEYSTNGIEIIQILSQYSELLEQYEELIKSVKRGD
jgi:hypothetical protein